MRLSTAKNPMLFIIVWLASGASFALQPGDTTDQMTNELGTPQGRIEQGGSVTYFFAGGSVDVQNNKVLRLDEGMSQRAEQRANQLAEQQAFDDEQRRKGLMMYDGDWLTPAQIDILENIKRQPQRNQRVTYQQVTPEGKPTSSNPSLDGTKGKKMQFDQSGKQGVRNQFRDIPSKNAKSLSSFKQTGQGGSLLGTGSSSKKKQATPVRKPD